MTITTVDVFLARQSWANAPQAFVTLLASLLESPAKAQEFCLFAEHHGAVSKITSLAAHSIDRESLAQLVATLICSKAYVAAKKGDYSAAEYIWTMSLNFYPAHLPSKSGLAIMHFNMEDYGRALKYASEVIDAFERPSEQPGLIGDLVSGKYESEAAVGMGVAGIEGSSQAVLDQMRMIRDAIR